MCMYTVQIYTFVHELCLYFNIKYMYVKIFKKNKKKIKKYSEKRNLSCLDFY